MQHSRDSMYLMEKMIHVQEELDNYRLGSKHKRSRSRNETLKWTSEKSNKNMKARASVENSNKDFSLNLDLSRISMSFSGSSPKQTAVTLKDQSYFEPSEYLQGGRKNNKSGVYDEKENFHLVQGYYKRPPIVRNNSIHDEHSTNCSQTKRERSISKENAQTNVGSLLATAEFRSKSKDYFHSPGHCRDRQKEDYSALGYAANATTNPTTNPLKGGYLQYSTERERENSVFSVLKATQKDEQRGFLLPNSDSNKARISNQDSISHIRQDNQSLTIKGIDIGSKGLENDSSRLNRKYYYHSHHPSTTMEKIPLGNQQQQQDYLKPDSRRPPSKYPTGNEKHSRIPPKLNLPLKNESFDDQYSSDKLSGDASIFLTHVPKHVQNTERSSNKIVNSSQNLLEALATNKQKERLTSVSIIDTKLNQISINESITERGAQLSPIKKETDKNRHRRDSSSSANEVLSDLKATIKEKENELQELKNKRLKNDDETQTLFNQIKNMAVINKNCEDQIAKLKEEMTKKDFEISQLKSCKEKLEIMVQDFKLQIKKEEKEREGERSKVCRLEQILNEKSDEMTDLFDKMENLQRNSEKVIQNERIKLLLEKNALTEKLTESEVLIQKLQTEVEKNGKVKKEYALIDCKIEELENMQQSLITENDMLKKKLIASAQSNNSTTILRIYKDPKEAKENSLNLGCNPEIISLIIGATNRMGETQELAKKVTQVIQCIAKGAEPDIQLILKHNIAGKGNSHKETEFTMKGLKQRAQENSDAANGLNKIFLGAVDAVCDLYAIKFGAVCGL